MNVELKGIDDLRKALNRADAAVIDATKLAITDVVMEIAEMADDLVPFDTGNLSRSQTIERPGARLEGSVSYGGTAAPYALIQHEDESLSHPPKPPGRSKVGGRQGSGPVVAPAGRGAKFLEYPATEIGQDIDNKIVALVRRAL